LKLHVPALRLDLGAGLAWAAGLVSFWLAQSVPYFLNTFWQIPDGAEILRGHFPTSVSYAIESGPLVIQQWLYEAALAFANAHGAYGVLVAACALAAGATPLLTFALARRCGVPSTAAGVTAFAVAGSRFAASAIRPETFAVDAFALVLWLLPNARRRWWIVPVTIGWANIHASVILAPLAVGTLAAAALVGDRRPREAVSLGLLALACATATLVTPYGVRLWAYVIGIAVTPSVVSANLDAWRPLWASTPGQMFAVIPGIFVFAAFGIVVRRRHAGELALAALCFALTIAHARYATFLAVAWSVPLARTLAFRTPFGTILRSARPATALALLPLVIFAAAAVPATLRTRPDPPGPWRTAAAIAVQNHLSGNAYVTYAWGAYLHWQGVPLRLLIDAHGDPYPPAVWRDHLALDALAPDWRGVLERRSIGVAIVASNAPLARALMHEPEWRTLEIRDGVAAFSRRVADP
jgi:hypothetical protein